MLLPKFKQRIKRALFDYERNPAMDAIVTKEVFGVSSGNNKSGTISITQPSTTALLGTKKAATGAVISANGGFTLNKKKGARGFGTISRSSAVSSAAKKGGKWAATLVQAGVVASQGKKNAKSAALIDQASFVFVLGDGAVIINKDGTVAVVQNSTVGLNGKKSAKTNILINQANLMNISAMKLGGNIMSVLLGSIVHASGAKQSRRGTNIVSGAGVDATSQKTSFGLLALPVGSVVFIRGRGPRTLFENISNLSANLATPTEITTMSNKVIHQNAERKARTINQTANIGAIINISAVKNMTEEVLYKMSSGDGKTIQMVAGETKIIKITVLDALGAPALLDGSECKFAIEGVIADKPCTINGNVITVRIEPSETTKPCKEWYEFRIRDVDSNVESLIIGTIEIGRKIVQTL